MNHNGHKGIIECDVVASSVINLYLVPEQNQKHTIQRQPGDQLPVGFSPAI